MAVVTTIPPHRADGAGASPIDARQLTGGQPALIPMKRHVVMADLPPIQRGVTGPARSIPLHVPELTGYSTNQTTSGLSATAPSVQYAVQTTLAPVLGLSFIGLDQPLSDCPCEPPDTNVTAGPNEVVETVNLAVRVFDKLGHPLQTFALSNLFGLGPNFASDARIRYDSDSGRWFISMLSLDNQSLASSSQGYWNIAVSDSENVSTGEAAFTTYQIATPGSFPDQPGLGFSGDKVVMTGNAFACGGSSGCGGGYVGNEFIVLNKSDLVALPQYPGGIVRADYYPPDEDFNAFTIQPARELIGTNESMPDTLYMAGVQYPSASSIDVFEITGTPSGVAPPSTNLSITSFGIAPESAPVAAPNPGGKSPIDTGDNRLQDAVWRDGQLWLSANTSCIPPGDKTQRACLQYIQIFADAADDPPTIGQDFVYGGQGMYYYYPAIELDSADNLITVFSGSSSSPDIMPSVFSAARLASDPPNTLGVASLIKSGETSYSGTRWGDYSGAGLDPSDQVTVWVGGQYSASLPNDPANWSTWIASLTAPGPAPSATPTPGAISLGRRHVGFGRVGTEIQSTENFNIRNTSKIGTLIVTLSPPGNDFTVLGPLNFSIFPKQSTTVQVQFAPTNPISYDASIGVTSNDPKHATEAVSLAGVGAPPILRAPGRLTMPPVSAGTASIKSFNIRNAGAGVMHLNVSMVTPSAQINSPATSGPFELNKGQTLSVTVQTTPQAVGPYTAQLEIQSNDPKRPTMYVNLVGKAR